MPNWNVSIYKITGEKKDLKDLVKRLKRLEKRKTPRVKNGFGKLWLGCILDEFKKDWHEIPCRGSIIDYDYCDFTNVLSMELETAWAECSDFRHTLESIYPGMKIYHYSEEPGMGIYESNDIDHLFFEDSYSVETNDDGWASFPTKQEALDYISEILEEEVTEKNLEESLRFYNDENFENDKWVYYHEINFYKE